MYSFDNSELPNHSDSYLSNIASVHKYQTWLVSLQTYHLPRMKASLGQLSLKYILKTDISPLACRLIHLENNTKMSCYLAKIPGDFRFTCLSLF